VNRIIAISYCLHNTISIFLFGHLGAKRTRLARIRTRCPRGWRRINGSWISWNSPSAPWTKRSGRSGCRGLPASVLPAAIQSAATGTTSTILSRRTADDGLPRTSPSPCHGSVFDDGAFQLVLSVSRTLRQFVSTSSVRLVELYFVISLHWRKIPIGKPHMK
jgi:hypothetical protein